MSFLDKFNDKVPAPAKEVSTDNDLMKLARLFDGTHPSVPWGAVVDLTSFPEFATYARKDTLEKLVERNVIVPYGDDGYGRGWKWDSFVNARFNENEPPPVAK